MRVVCKEGELQESLNIILIHGNPQPSSSNCKIFIVDGKVQRPTGEDLQTNKPDTSALSERNEMVRASAERLRSKA